LHQTLYRKYRPSCFDSVVGQAHITSVLSYQVKTGKTTHAYLFCGSRGTGKTSCAKILAKAVNCLEPISGSPCGKCEACRMIESGAATDVLEMDAASNNGVDYIRDIKDEVAYPPAMLKNRVYIIDEVHMLSPGAFNAMLKTLEEPPPHVVFILATTELQKIPATILSRCQRFDFRRITVPIIADRLKFIAESENIEYDYDALSFIARLAHGGMRDAISLLELCSGGGQKITTPLVREKVGVGGHDLLERVFHAVMASDCKKIFETVGDVYSSSVDITAFWQELSNFCRDLIIVKTVPSPERFIDTTGEELASLKALASSTTKEQLLGFSTLIEDSYASMQKAGESKRVIAEMALVRMCNEKSSLDYDSLTRRIAALEEKLSQLNSGVTSNSVPEAPAEKSPAESATEIKAQSRAAVSAEPPKKVEAGAVRVETASAEAEYSIASDTEGSKKSEEKQKMGRVPFEFAAETAEKLLEKEPAAASMLKLAKMFASDRKLIISVKDDISAMLLSAGNTPDVIAGIVSVFPGFAGISANDIEIIMSNSKEVEFDLIDEALSELE